MPDVQYFDLVSHAVENFVGVANDEYHPDVRIVRLVR